MGYYRHMSGGSPSQRPEEAAGRRRRGLSSRSSLGPLLNARRWTPWEGRGARGDWVLLALIAVIAGLGVAIRPLRPFLIAAHPVLLELLDGGIAAIGAAAAFARIDELPLWLVVLAGVAGMAKFDWLTWWVCAS